jgi:hypothetical protein
VIKAESFLLRNEKTLKGVCAEAWILGMANSRLAVIIILTTAVRMAKKSGGVGNWYRWIKKNIIWMNKIFTNQTTKIVPCFFF